MPARDCDDYAAECERLIRKSGDDVRALREHLGFSRKEFAELARRHRAGAGNLEREGREGELWTGLSVIGEALAVALASLEEGVPARHSERGTAAGGGAR
jgi:hypothetical protein